MPTGNSGGIDGFVYPGATFSWQSSLIFGAAIQRADDFVVSDGAIVIADEKRSHVYNSDLLSDFRRSSSSLSSIANYLGQDRIARTGVGHFRECSYEDAILSLSDVYLPAKRIPQTSMRATLTSWNHFLSFRFRIQLPTRTVRHATRMESSPGLIPPRVKVAYG